MPFVVEAPLMAIRPRTLAHLMSAMLRKPLILHVKVGVCNEII